MHVAGGQRGGVIRGMAGVVLLCALAASCAQSGTNAGGGSSTPPGSGVPVTTVERDAGQPVRGGQLNVGIDAETNDFNPATGQWSPSSYAIANAIFDPLVAMDDQGIAKPYLAESIAPNSTFTQWVFKLRPGVTFHDGTPVNAAAVKRNLDNMKSSALTGQAFTVITAITATDDLTMTIDMSQPWATFPSTLSTQSGYILAPSMLDDPAGASAKIVGSGPFVFVSRQRDAGVRGERNEKYWQKDKTGAALPYLDKIEFKIITDPSSRNNARKAGEVDAMLANGSADLYLSSQEEANRGEVQRLSTERAEADESILAFNTSKEPFNDPLARQILAYGIDQDEMSDIALHGAFPGAWGMFSEGSPYYISRQEAGYPTRDIEKAKSMAADYEKAHGHPLEFTVVVTASVDTLAVMQAYQAEMTKFGVKMNISSVETTQLINKVIVAGDYQAAYFVLWSSPTPDQGYVFIATPANPNGISLNFPRYDDPEVKAALDEFRASADPQRRIDAMKRVQKALAKNMQVLFLAHAQSAFIYGNNVHGFTKPTFPGTDAPAYNPYPTTPFYIDVWKSAA